MRREERYGYQYEPEKSVTHNVSSSTLWDRWRSEHAPTATQVAERARVERAKLNGR